MNKSDIDLSEIEFDHDDLSFVKIRTYGGNVHYIQNGIKFNAGFVATEVLEVIDPGRKRLEDMSIEELRTQLREIHEPSELSAVMPKKKKKKSQMKVAATPATPRQSADDKLSGYKDPEKPDFVQTALNENSEALQAEERAE